jgi:peptide/nickel transport system permease protein
MAATDIRATQPFVIPEPPIWAQRARAVFGFVRTYPLGAAGGFFAVMLILMAAVPEAFTPLESQNPLKQVLAERLDGPSWQAWFGRDELGRDLYSRVVHGARTSILIGFGVVLFANALSLTMGTISGYYGGRFDMLFQRLVDIGIAVPNLVFIILVVQTVAPRIDDVVPGHGDELAIVMAVALVVASGASRTVRGVALSLRQAQFVEAARTLGATDGRTMLRHIVPNLFPVVIVSASILVGGAVLVESSLSFLGYGVQPPTPSWGRMLNDARPQLVRAPHLAIFPGLVIFLTVFSFNMLGDALRDKLDPRLRGSN